MNDAVYKFKRYEDASLTYTGIDSHESDTMVGLYSTSITREEYDAMAGLQQQSMQAPAPDARDVPERPYAVNPPGEEEEEAPTPIPAKREPAKPETKPAPQAKPVTPKEKAMPTYRPAFVPPRPAALAAKSTEKPKVDVSRIGAGTRVIHRAFGEGTVVKIEMKANGNAHVHVLFGETVKSFGFPGAFYDGFLKVRDEAVSNDS